MRVVWESADWPGSRVDVKINQLAWTAVGSSTEEGLIAAATASGSVGITQTRLYPASHAASLNYYDKHRPNFNLRGHHSSATHVAWNSRANKLASCDSSGVVYVWARNEDRWSVELVNDRGVKVRSIGWSPCGSSALICYEDQFVLVGSAAGQRIWSHTFDEQITAGAWAPDSWELVLGTASGRLLVYSPSGQMLRERQLLEHTSVTALAYGGDARLGKGGSLAALLDSNRVLILFSYDQVVPFEWRASAAVVKLEWDGRNEMLAVLTQNNELVFLHRDGRVRHREPVRVPSWTGDSTGPSAFCWMHQGIAFCVASNSAIRVGRIVRGVSSLYDTVRVSLWHQLGRSSRARRAALARLPESLRKSIGLDALDWHIIQCVVPSRGGSRLLDWLVSPHLQRTHCTMRAGGARQAGQRSLVLCVEHMGGLVPVMVGRQMNRVLPQFNVALYADDTERQSSEAMSAEASTGGRTAAVEDLSHNGAVSGRAAAGAGNAADSDTDDSTTGTSTAPTRLSVIRRSARRLRSMVEGRRAQRQRQQQQLQQQHQEAGAAEAAAAAADDDDSLQHRITTADTPSCAALGKQTPATTSGVWPSRESRMARVESNVWCTRFRLTSAMSNATAARQQQQSSAAAANPSQHGSSDSQSNNTIGSVSYKTSVLHLQPRQMTVQLPHPVPSHHRRANRSANNNNNNNSTARLLQPPPPSSQLIAPVADNNSSNENNQNSTHPHLTHDELVFLARLRDDCIQLRTLVETALQDLQHPSSSILSTTTATADPVSQASTGHDVASDTLSVTSDAPEELPSLVEELPPPVSERSSSSPVPAPTSSSELATTFSERITQLSFIDDSEHSDADDLTGGSSSNHQQRQQPALTTPRIELPTDHDDERTELVERSAPLRRSIFQRLSLGLSMRRRKDGRREQETEPQGGKKRRGQRLEDAKRSGEERKTRALLVGVLDALVAFEVARRGLLAAGAESDGGGDTISAHHYHIGSRRRSGRVRSTSDWRKASGATTRALRLLSSRLDPICKRPNNATQLLQLVPDPARTTCVDCALRLYSALHTSTWPSTSQHKRRVTGSSAAVQPAASETAASSGCPPSLITLHNKTPFWNEHNQVYQLDFGGRVTQESAKNFQIELPPESGGQQVLQFGRIEAGCYTLDYRAPFSAVQAFGVALASITQRLK